LQYAFLFVIIFAVIGVMRLGVNAAALPWLIPVMLIQFVLVLGMNLITSAVTVYVRDLEHIMGVISMAWMYLSPVVYGISFVPESWHRWYLLNPMAPLLLAYRDILYYQTAPALSQLLPAAVISFAVLGVGALTFSRLQRRFAEEL
jgi:ABC-2 type transport system permease protein